jgi:hypothetical protein
VCGCVDSRHIIQLASDGTVALFEMWKPGQILRGSVLSELACDWLRKHEKDIDIAPGLVSNDCQVAQHTVDQHFCWAHGQGMPLSSPRLSDQTEQQWGRGSASTGYLTW